MFFRSHRTSGTNWCTGPTGSSWSVLFAVIFCYLLGVYNERTKLSVVENVNVELYVHWRCENWKYITDSYFLLSTIRLLCSFRRLSLTSIRRQLLLWSKIVVILPWLYILVCNEHLYLIYFSQNFPSVTDFETRCNSRNHWTQKTECPP